jgi:hypothetical protein
MTPNWQTTASNAASGKSRFIASACRHSTGRLEPISVAWSSMAWFRSVATIEAFGGSFSASARVTTPVPAAISSTRCTGRVRSRFASSLAYGWKISGTR